MFYCLSFQNLSAQNDSVNSVKPFVIPAVLMAGGLITQGQISRNVRDEVLKTYPNFHAKFDDYMQFGTTAIPLGMSLVGIEGKHKFKDQLILSVLSHGLAQTITQSLKYIVAYPRPDGVGMESFPSGHTTSAFTGATIMANEYGQRSVAYSIAGYGLATVVGSFRILKNRHWTADVLFGAGVGIAATETVYLVYPWLQKKVFKNKNWVTLPTYGNGVAGVYATRFF